MPEVTRSLAARAAVFLLAAVLVSACGESSDLGTDRSAKSDVSPTQQLLTRPTSEQARQDYQDQLVSVRKALTRLAPNVEWDDQPPTSTGDSGCGDPFDAIEGSSSASFLTGGGGAIPDDDWGRAVTVTAEVLKASGYDKMQVTVDKPGLHSVSFYGPYGAEITLAGQRSTTIQLMGGCFLDAETHQKAKSENR